MSSLELRQDKAAGETECRQSTALLASFQGVSLVSAEDRRYRAEVPSTLMHVMVHDS